MDDTIASSMDEPMDDVMASFIDDVMASSLTTP